MVLLHVNLARTVGRVVLAFYLATLLSHQTARAEDCNNNGIEDATDIADSRSVDCQPDGVPDECQLKYRWPPVISDPVPLQHPSDQNWNELSVTLASNEAGVVVAVWGNEVTSSYPYRIASAMSLNGGATWHGHTLVGFGHVARLATDRNGNWVALWGGPIELRDDATYPVISRSTDDGRFWTSPALFPTGYNPNVTPTSLGSIAADGDGKWITALHVSTRLAVATSVDALNWSAPVFLHGKNNGHSGVIATDRGDTWIVVWQSTVDVNGNGSDGDLLYSRSLDDGATWSAPLPLNESALFDNGVDHSHRVITDRAGRWLVVWQSNGFFGPDEDILFSYSVDNGQSWSESSAVNANALMDLATDNDWYPAASTNGRGDWLVTWTSFREASGGDVQVAYTNDVSGEWSSSVRVNVAPSGASAVGSSAITWDGLRGWSIAWRSKDKATSDFDVLTARLLLPFSDCNGNKSPDECDLAGGGSSDCSGNGVLDECEADCNGNDTPDDCDILAGSPDQNSSDIPDECESPALMSVFPPRDRSLWRFGKNRIRLTLDLPVNPPPVGALQIRELLPNGAFGEDVSSFFTAAASGKDLILQEIGPGLQRRKWYELSSKNWPGGHDFSIDFLAQPGDVNNDRQTNFTDLVVVKTRIPMRAADMTEALSYYDVNADGIISFSDMATVNSFIPSTIVAKPSGH